MQKLGALLQVILLFTIAKHACSIPAIFWPQCVDSTGNYTEKDAYAQNLKVALSDLVFHASTMSFYNSTAGEAGINKVYALFYCRGDIGPDDCHDCVQTAVLDAPIWCPSRKEVIMWFFQCTLRYTNRSIFSQEEEFLWSFGFNPVNVSNPTLLEQVVSTTMNRLILNAAYNSTKGLGFATGFTNYSNSNISFLVQCTPDILGSKCEKCLTSALGHIRTGGPKAAYVLMPSCQVIYDFDSFIYGSDSPPNLPPSTKGKKKMFVFSSIVALPTAAAVSLLWGFSIVYFIDTNKSSHEKKDSGALRDEIPFSGTSYLSESSKSPEVSDPGQSEIEYSGPHQFDFEIIKDATADFSRANELGRGGFGIVYKGKLPNGLEVAVKRLSLNSGQGAKEFKTEVHVVAKLHHRNLVRLLGYSVEGEERLLIYELMPNSSLDRFLSDANKREHFEWKARYKIIVGISRGLLYLHEDSELRIVHRDLKPSNILLDADLNPKIADFGMARLFELDQTQANTSRVVGTIGYMAPEYIINGQFSTKSDVYSFGVIILELISGQLNSFFYRYSPYTSEGLIYQAWRVWLKGTFQELVDPTLKNNYPETEVVKCIHIALLCVQEAAARRPTMPEVFSMLSNSSLELPPPTPPAAFIHGLRD